MNEAVRKLDARIWDRDPDDFYIEPEWCSRRLFVHERFVGDVVDPACGTGRICVAAAEAGLDVVGTDLRNRWGDAFPRVERGLSPTLIQQDFLSTDWGYLESRPAWWRSQCKVAMLLPSKWMYGDKRSRWLATTPLYKVLAITPRPSMPPGRVILEGVAPGGGKEDFAWFIWLKGYVGSPATGWLWRDAP